MTQQPTVDFACEKCSKQIRVAKDLVGRQVRCPFCQSVVLAINPKPTTSATAIPIAEASDESLPSLESLQATKNPEFDLPDELDANVASMPQPPQNELANLVDGVLDQTTDAPSTEDPTAPIKLDDQEDMYGADNVIGITCHVCDTRIHVKKEQIGTQVECPDCFVQVPIHDPKTRKKHWGRGGLTAPEQRQNESEARQDPLRPNPTIATQPDTIKSATIKQSGGGAAALPSLDELQIEPATPVAPTDPSSGSQPLVTPTNDELDDLEELTLEAPLELLPVEPVAGLDPLPNPTLVPDPSQTSGNIPSVDKLETPVPIADDELHLEPLEEIADPPDRPPAATHVPPMETPPVVPGPPVPPQPVSSNNNVSPPVAAPITQPTAAPAATQTESTKPASAKRSKKKSRRERLEAAQNEGENQTPEGEIPFELPESQRDFPDFSHGDLLSGIKTMLLSPHLWWITILAMTLMTLGSIARIHFFPPGFSLESGEFGAFLGAAVSAIFLGVVPYYVGLVLLWLLAAYMFRDAALGRRKVDSWGFRGFSELQGTFLLFAFSFFVAGSVAIFLPPLMIPLRMMLAPLFLAAAYFNRSVWGLVAADIFTHFGKQKFQWLHLYIWMVALSGIGLVAGFLFWLRGENMQVANIIMTPFGVLLNTMATLVFAPLAGWHAGLISQDLQKDEF